MLGVMKVLMLPLLDSWNRKMFSVFLFMLLCPTLSLFFLGVISY